MFETICIRNQYKSNDPIDLGFLAEAMLFYQQVRIVGNHVVLKQLVKQCGADTLIELLKNGFLKISYQTNNAGIQTLNTNSPNEIHSPILFSSTSTALQNIAPQIFIEATGRSGRGRRLGNRFASLVETVSYPETMTKAIEVDFAAKNYVKEAVLRLLKIHTPEYKIPSPFEFEIIQNAKGFTVKTNIDFRAANESYHISRVVLKASRMCFGISRKGLGASELAWGASRMSRETSEWLRDSRRIDLRRPSKIISTLLGIAVIQIAGMFAMIHAGGMFVAVWPMIAVVPVPVPENTSGGSQQGDGANQNKDDSHGNKSFHRLNVAAMGCSPQRKSDGFDGELHERRGRHPPKSVPEFGGFRGF
ncbi:MAG TPA: hypothetical protein VK810_00105 [Dongiaceae bacterium]|nr:hypothetical protein [Dongiaceae bacterium]